MRKGEKLRSNTVRRQETLKQWSAIVADFKSDIPAPEIAENHLNPKTNRPYSTRHVYWILRRMGVTI